MNQKAQDTRSVWKKPLLLDKRGFFLCCGKIGRYLYLPLLLEPRRGTCYTLPASKSDRDAGGTMPDLLNRGIWVKYCCLITIR